MRKWIDIDGHMVVHMLLEHSGLTFSGLCNALGFDKHSSHPGPMSLFNCLDSLFSAGLVVADGISNEEFQSHLENIFFFEDNVKFRASTTYWKMQMVLGMKYMGGKRPSDDPMTVYPQFKLPTASALKSDIFVLMPFNNNFTPIYKDHIIKVAESLNLTIRRADDIFSNNHLMVDIWGGICGAGVIVADCTGRNPNVFYEIGIAHTVGKQVVLITQSVDDVPADLRHIKYIKYEYTPPGMKNFEESLSKTIHNLLGMW